MLKKVILKNIQSHKKTIINFSSGLNVIIGGTDTGKTALKRGIEWPVTNQPEGRKFKDEFLSLWADTASSKLIFDDCTIERVRGKNKNYYKLNDRTLQAFGRNVPEDVKKAINMTDINFQSHTEPFFLLSKTPPEIAKYLNRITDLEIIDDSISNIRKEKLATEREIKNIEEQIDEIKKKLKTHRWIDKAIGFIEQIKIKDNKIKTLLQKIEKGSKLIDQLISLQKKRDQLKFDPVIKKETERLLKEQTKAESKEKEISLIEDKIKGIKQKRERLKKVAEQIEEKITKFKAKMPPICLLCGQRVKKPTIA